MFMAVAFALEDIDLAHRGVTSATVRQYLTTLHGLGIVSYTTHISDGHSEYFDGNGDGLHSAAVHERYDVSDRADRDAARQAIEAHQSQATDYFMFSRQLAAAGVGYWIMDTVRMTCTFCSKADERLIEDDV
jgi:uncharacterized protein YbcV (DUF1398 family)